MITRTINLNGVDSVKDFCKLCEEKANFSVDVGSGRYIVDGKSILGLFSLDLSKPVNITIHADGIEAKNFLDEIKTLICE